MPPVGNRPDQPGNAGPAPAGERLPVLPSGPRAAQTTADPAGIAAGQPQLETNPTAAADAPLEERVIATLRRIRDPELPVNIYDLGLIYGLELSADGDVTIRMTLTTPACPVARSLPGQVEQRVRAVAGVRGVRVELVWDPPWTQDRLSDAARLQLGLL